mgnify:CR=1 FL=1
MDRADKPRRGSYFLAAQHQLRQPLNALSLLIGELRQAADGRDREAIVDDMRYALDLSNAWLDSLADLEKAEEGLLRLQPQDLPLNQIFARLRDEFLPHFSHLGLDFRVVPTRAVVRADPVALRRLLSLLLDNAAKFTRDGKILLGCRRDGDRLRVEVRDTGLGMAEEARGRLFEPFFRLENEVRPRERGLGLGLAYAKHLAELAGEELAVDSRLGRGSCFALSLPLVAAGHAAGADGRQGANGTAAPLAQAPGNPAPGNSAPGNPLAGTKVLLLDGAEAQELHARLQDWGAAATVVPAAGLAAALAAGPHLIVADRQIFTAARGWEALQQAGARPAVGLITDSPAGDAEGSGGAENGAAHYLARPVKPARLRSLCHYALSRS